MRRRGELETRRVGDAESWRRGELTTCGEESGVDGRRAVEGVVDGVEGRKWG